MGVVGYVGDLVVCVYINGLCDGCVDIGLFVWWLVYFWVWCVWFVGG